MTAHSKPADNERGIILVNVLMFVAIASGLVLLMITREENALDRASRLREATRALEVVHGGELSAVVALRRDQAKAPDTDHPGEPWAALAERGAKIEGGTFDLTVADAQGRFNLNNLMIDSDLEGVQVFSRIAKAAGLDDAQIAAALLLVRANGPLTGIGPLRAAGLAPEAAAKLQTMVTALPGTTDINANTASQELLGVLFENPEAAARLIALRGEQGFLSRADIAKADVWIPHGVGFASRTYWVRTRATIGETSQQQAALIVRRPVTPGGPSETVVVARWRNAAIPADAPPLGGS